MTRSARFVSALALFVILAAPCVAATVEVAGVPNFHQVDERIFRGAQPTEQAWPGLASLGVQIVVDLRREG